LFRDFLIKVKLVFVVTILILIINIYVYTILIFTGMQGYQRCGAPKLIFLSCYFSLVTIFSCFLSEPYQNVSVNGKSCQVGGPSTIPTTVGSTDGHVETGSA